MTSYCPNCGNAQPCSKCERLLSDDPCGDQSRAHQQDVRAQIARDVKAFLKAGGKVTKVPQGDSALVFLRYEDHHKRTLDPNDSGKSAVISKDRADLWRNICRKDAATQRKDRAGDAMKRSMLEHTVMRNARANGSKRAKAIRANLAD